jgi:hypothetical protein
VEISCWLTTPHKLQGRGALGKLSPCTVRLCRSPRKPMAAPCQLHAVVRLRQGRVETMALTAAANTRPVGGTLAAQTGVFRTGVVMRAI